MLTLFVIGLLAGSGTFAALGWWWLQRRRRHTWLQQQFWTINTKLDALRSSSPHPAGRGVS